MAEDKVSLGVDGFDLDGKMASSDNFLRLANLRGSHVRHHAKSQDKIIFLNFYVSRCMVSYIPFNKQRAQLFV